MRLFKASRTTVTVVNYLRIFFRLRLPNLIGTAPRIDSTTASM